MGKKYMRQWKIPSHSGNGIYTVSQNFDGSYECSCKGWIFKYRKQGTICGHIQDVLDGLGDTIEDLKYEFRPSNTREVKQETLTLYLVPMIAFDDHQTDFTATILFDLAVKFGVPWKAIKEHFKNMMGPSWTRDNVLEHVYRKGRCILVEDWRKTYGYEYNRVWEVVSGTESREQERKAS